MSSSGSDQTEARPIIIDLCCGSGSWSDAFEDEGYRPIGFDIVRHPLYRHELVLQSVETVSGLPWRGKIAGCIASPPCTEFSQCWAFNRTRVPDPIAATRLVEHCYRIAREAEVPIILENVRGAQKWLGYARAHADSFYLWGDVPALLPTGPFHKGIWKRKHHHEKVKHVRDPILRARIPTELARFIARTWPVPAGT